MFINRTVSVIYFVFLVALTNVIVTCGTDDRNIPDSGFDTWEEYNGQGFMHYSTLNQINTENVHSLKEAWRYDTGDATPVSEMETSPLIIDSVLYAVSPRMRVIALNGATGKELWIFNPYEDGENPRRVRTRGLAYWESGTDRRIFFTSDHYLYAISAADGNLITSFGDRGRVDMRKGLGRDPESINIGSTSPGVVYKDLIIVGSAVSEGLPSAPGDIRAYEVRTGEMRWTFHTIPRPGEPGYETWPEDAWSYTGGANAWAGLSVDQSRGLVFASTGSAAFDFFGANRIGDNLYANCLLALNADTGELEWFFQGVKHDVWDRDFPTPPTLVTVKQGNQLTDAVAQPTKSGYIFLFSRESGQPIYPIEYRKLPDSDVPGEVLADSQPFPVKPPPFARQQFTEDMVTNRTPGAHDSVLSLLQTLRSGPQFTPPSFEGTVMFPGFDGGAEWGGAAFDPETGLLYVNSNEMAWILRLVEREDTGQRVTSQELYLNQCASCHGRDLQGTPPEFPSLRTLSENYTLQRMDSLLLVGSLRMPAFAYLSVQEREAIINYVLTRELDMVATNINIESPYDLRYRHDGYIKIHDPDGYPGVKPPWGTLNALNLDSAQYAWQIPLGEYPALAEQGEVNTGSENYGGPIVTSGGVLFIAATLYDSKFRAFDKLTGELLWETTLPAAGTATPATYEINGIQYVVIAAGGGKGGTPTGGSYVAFALPDTLD